MISPLRDLLYIIPFPPAPVSKIIIDPGGSESKGHQWRRSTQGIVKYRGPLTTGEIRVGDHVLFSGYDGDEIVVEGEGSLLVLPEDSLHARFTDEPRSYVITTTKAKELVNKAFAEVAQTSDHNDRMVLDRINQRVNEKLYFLFNSELYF